MCLSDSRCCTRWGWSLVGADCMRMMRRCGTYGTYDKWLWSSLLLRFSSRLQRRIADLRSHSMNYTEQTLADAVVARLDCEDERFKKVMSSLIRNMHAFVREVEPTEEEWLKLARLVCMSRAPRFTRQQDGSHSLPDQNRTTLRRQARRVYSPFR